LAITSLIKSGPIAEQRRPETGIAVQHKLASMRVPGQRQRQPIFNGRVEGVRMMRQKDWKSIRAALFDQFAHMTGNDAVIGRSHAIYPAQSQELNGIAADHGNCGFIH